MNVKKTHKSPMQFLREYGTDYLFAAPFFILFALFTLVPIVASAALSLTDFNAVSVHKFVGIQNYLNLILDDGLFLQALKNTFFLSVVTGPVGYFLCLLVAWLLNELGDKTRSLITLLFYAPVISGGAYTVWQIIYSGDAYGFLNGILLELGLIDAPIQWLTDTDYMMPAAIVRNRFQELWYITLPYMKPQLMFSAIMSITGAFGIGDVITAVFGFPTSGYTLHTLVHHMQDYGNTRFEMGYASSVAIVLFIIMIAANGLVQKLLRKVGD